MSWSFSSIAQTLKTQALSISDTIQQTIKDQQSQFQEEERKNKELKLKKKSEKRHAGEACAPWQVFDEAQSILQDELKQRIVIATSSEDQLLSVEVDDQDVLDMTAVLPFCLEALNGLAQLRPLQAALVPSRLSERGFWQRFFAIVQSIRQSMGISELDLPKELPTVDSEEEEGEGEESQAVQLQKQAAAAVNSLWDGIRGLAKDGLGSSSTSTDTEPKQADTGAGTGSSPAAQQPLEELDLEALAELTGPGDSLANSAANPSTGDDFASEDFVTVGMQDADLMSQMKEELGITDAQPSDSAQPSADQTQAVDLDLDSLESMLADVDIQPATSDTGLQGDDELAELEKEIAASL